MERLRFIDGDAHILEPQDIWDEYLEKKYKGTVGKGFARWAHASTLAQGEARLQEKGQEDPLCFNMEIEVMGRQVPNRAPRDPRVGVDGNPLVQGTDSDQAFGSTANQETGVTIIEDRELNDLSDAYGKWADENFPARAYREVMDTHGIDYMILYPTVGFWITGAAEMDGETATAIRRAYNRWLGDFTKDIGHGACGAASIDLRDPELARKEVERCVKEYDFKAVHLNPAPVPNLRLFDEVCDPLWETCADLGVPIGLHPSANHPFDQGMLDYIPGLRNCRTTVSFVMGSMMACTSLIMGGVLERHPKLKVVFLESGCGWASFWPDRLESGIQGGTRGLKINGLSRMPKEYFSEQCFVAADQDDPNITDVINNVGDHVIVSATDFGHPEGRHYATAVGDVMKLEGVSQESKKKLLWDNALRAYPIKP